MLTESLFWLMVAESLCIRNRTGTGKTSWIRWAVRYAFFYNGWVETNGKFTEGVGFKRKQVRKIDIVQESACNNIWISHVSKTIDLDDFQRRYFFEKEKSLKEFEIMRENEKKFERGLMERFSSCKNEVRKSVKNAACNTILNILWIDQCFVRTLTH